MSTAVTRDAYAERVENFGREICSRAIARYAATLVASYGLIKRRGQAKRERCSSIKFLIHGPESALPQQASDCESHDPRAVQHVVDANPFIGLMSQIQNSRTVGDAVL